MSIKELPVEAVVVDDGSSDGTSAIADRYAKADSRITVIHQDNAGRSSARNVGIGIARGEWLMFLDADDYLLPQAGALLLDAKEDKESSMIIFPYITPSSSENDEGVAQYSVRGASSLARDTPNERRYSVTASSIAKLMLWGGWDKLQRGRYEENSCWGRMYRRSDVIDLIGVLPDGWEPFPPQVRFSEDRIFNLTYLLHEDASEVTFLSPAIYCWDTVASSTVSHTMLEDISSVKLFYDRSLQLVSCGLLDDVECASLVARETILQFRRSVFSSANSLELTRAWQDALAEPAGLSACLREAPSEALYGLKAWRPALKLLGGGRVRLACHIYKSLALSKRGPWKR